MADVNVNAILGNPPPAIDPLKLANSYQDYQNKLQLNQNMQLQNQTGQQALAQTRVQRHNQIMFGLINLPDDQLPGAAKQALDAELATKQIDPQRYAVMSQHMQQMTPAQLRREISAGRCQNDIKSQWSKELRMGTKNKIADRHSSGAAFTGFLGE